MKRQQIKDVFTKYGSGVLWLWFSGVEGEGEYKEWYDNGQLFEQRFYKDGLAHGEYKSWHENGQKNVDAFFKNGQEHGEWKAWYDDGQLWVHKLYKDGELVKDYLK